MHLHSQQHQRLVQSECLPDNRPAAMTGHFEETHKCEPAKYSGEQSSGLKG